MPISCEDGRQEAVNVSAYGTDGFTGGCRLRGSNWLTRSIRAGRARDCKNYLQLKCIDLTPGKMLRRKSPTNAVELVREHVKLIDEISKVQYLEERHMKLLEKLRDECTGTDFGDDDIHRGILGRLMEQIDWASKKINEKTDKLPLYIRDLKSSLDVASTLHAPNKKWKSTNNQQPRSSKSQP